MTTPADQGIQAARQDHASEREIRDALQLWDSDALYDAILCTKPESWLARLIRNELVARGIGHKGEWVGVERARQVWR